MGDGEEFTMQCNGMQAAAMSFAGSIFNSSDNRVVVLRATKLFMVGAPPYSDSLQRQRRLKHK